MGNKKTRTWQEISAAQESVISLRQLRGIGVTRAAIRHHLTIGRWAQRSSEVLTTTTGPASHEQRLWIAALHAGGDSLIGGLSAAAVHGMKNWSRDDVTVLVNNPLSLEPLEGVVFFRTRRDLATLSAPTALPLCRLEPAVLLFSGYEFNQRTAHGAIAAAVQQRLTTTTKLRSDLALLSPLRRAQEFRLLLDDLEGGSQSLAEVDVRKACREFGVVPPTSQTKRKDRSGRTRFTDCEWRVADGRVIVLEVDGSFHDDVLEASAHRARNRKLTSTTRVVVQCSAYEIRHEPWEVMEDLIALGVPRISAAS
ncbi:MAG: hypothetical protein ABIR39_11220 [Nocardioides sp.]|uniref:hypothetical protein n=1 Tax=Nocardioides sp. TaxID=35761 RepID=UPI0032655189